MKWRLSEYLEKHNLTPYQLFKETDEEWEEYFRDLERMAND